MPSIEIVLEVWRNHRAKGCLVSWHTHWHLHAIHTGSHVHSLHATHTHGVELLIHLLLLEAAHLPWHHPRHHAWHLRLYPGASLGQLLEILLGPQLVVLGVN